jgi:hypothetical protein
MRKMMLCVIAMSTATLVPAQGQSPEAPVQVLLQEVRQLRQELQGMAVVAQRVQLLLYRIQLQEQVVTKATNRYDEVSGRLQRAEVDSKFRAERIKQMEEQLSTVSEKAPKKELEESIASSRAVLQEFQREVQEAHAEEIAAGVAVRDEKAAAASLHERLDQLERQLETQSRAKPAVQ